jgi:hypothetical protein
MRNPNSRNPVLYGLAKSYSVDQSYSLLFGATAKPSQAAATMGDLKQPSHLVARTCYAKCSPGVSQRENASEIDEATGYQYERASDALQIKLRLFLAEEMRKWEKTFPDQLWEQVGRLTNWKGSIHSRPKYWGNLVMELIYQYLDPDVAEWLRENAPKPQHGKNYHQWLSEQYGLRKLVEHIWKVVGIASTCASMNELRRKMQELYGKNAAFQFALKIVRKSETSGQGLLFDPRDSAS